MKLFEEPKKRYRNLLLILLPLLLAGGFFGYTLYSSAKEFFGGGQPAEEVEASPKYSIPELSYQLRADCTQVQFDYFQELIEAIGNEDDDAAVKAVAKSFIADFYTFSNKAGQYDVGGMSYMYAPQLPNIYLQARDHIYHYLNYFINEYGKENLLEVEQVTVEDFKRCDEDLTVEGTQHPSWYLRVSWTYVAKDSGFDTSDYETLQDIYIIKNVDSGRYEIVQIYGME